MTFSYLIDELNFFINSYFRFLFSNIGKSSFKLKALCTLFLTYIREIGVFLELCKLPMMNSSGTGSSET